METSDATTAIIRHPDELKDLAYQLWTYKAGRNATDVVRLLATPEYGGHTIPVRTVQYWASAGDWAKRAANDLRAVAPDMQERDVSELMIGRGFAVRYLRRVAEGLEDIPDLSDLAERQKNPDTMLDSVDLSLQLDARMRAHNEARKARIAACTAILDRTGLPAQRNTVASDQGATGSNRRNPVGPSRKLSEEDRERLADKLARLAAGDASVDG